MLNSRKPEDLCPRTRRKWYSFEAGCKDAGIDVILTATHRDNASQNALYAQGRTAPGNIVTNAKGGDSFHNYRVAFDFVPIVSGKAVWGDSALWAKCGVIGVAVGLEWGGNWHGFKDKPHMQDVGGYSIADFKAGRVQSEYFL